MEQVPKFNTENYEDHRKFRKLDIIFVNTQVVQCSERSTMKVRKVHLEKRQTTWHECTTTIVGLRYVNPFKRGLYSMQDPIVQVAASKPMAPARQAVFRLLHTLFNIAENAKSDHDK